MTASPEPVAPAMRARIAAELAAVEREEGARILLAVESGSRAWGFPSPDSDYDVRFIYLRPLNWYLSIEPGRDVIEKPVSDTLDIGGWDLRKALGLILRSNAVALEWLRSPVVYRDHPALRADLLGFCAKALRRTPLTYHYLHLGEGQLRRCLTPEGQAKMKRYFYALRPALTLRWLRLHDGVATPPMDIAALLDQADPSAPVRAFAEALIARKRETRELGKFAPGGELSGFIETEFELARGWLADTPPEPNPGLTAEADALFRKWLRRFE